MSRVLRIATSVLHDPWLDRWLPLITQRARHAAVLELGCGSGHDTATLTAAGFCVVAVEIDPASIARARKRAPAARIFCQDLRQPLPPPTAGTGFDAVIASLSLHYFPWEETLRIVERVRDALGSGGLFLCRLNSTDDRHFGAIGHREIAPNYYMVHGSPKRFFDEPSVDALFSTGWRIRSKAHFTTHKYVVPKALWELVLERDA
jgi:SAM-dependent methyltransferase